MDRARRSSRLPAADLRALAWAMIAVVPLFAVQIVDSVWAVAVDGYSALEIVLADTPYFVQLACDVTGGVITALGVALMLRRDAIRQPLSFMTTALCVGLLMSVVDAAGSTLGLFQGYNRSDWSWTAMQHDIVLMVMRYTCQLAAIALASRLYLHWSQDAPNDGARFVVLCGIGAALAVASILNTSIAIVETITALPSETISPPLIALWWAQSAVRAFTGCVGAAFLFGLIAIAAVRRRDAKHEMGSAVLAGLGAASGFVLLRYGPSFIQYWVSDPNLQSLKYAIFDYKVLVAPFVAGAGGAVLYVLAVDGVSIRKSLANIPASIRSLRSWPYRPAEDEER